MSSVDKNQFNLSNLADNNEIADNVKAILKTKRLEHGFSQRQVGDICFKERSTIASWERTNPTKGPVMKPDYRDLVAMSWLYNVSIDHLFSNDRVIPSPEVGYIVKSRELYQLDNRPIFIEGKIDGKDFYGCGVVDATLKKVFIKGGQFIPFEKIDDFKCNLIPKDVYRKEAFLPDPLEVEDIQRFMSLPQATSESEDEKPKIWVSFTMQNNMSTQEMAGWFFVDSDKIYSENGIMLSLDMYNKTWIAFTDKPKAIWM